MCRCEGGPRVENPDNKKEVRVYRAITSVSLRYEGVGRSPPKVCVNSQSAMLGHLSEEDRSDTISSDVLGHHW